MKKQEANNLKILQALRAIGHLISWEFLEDGFNFKIGKRNVSDYETMKQLSSLQEKHLSHFPILDKIIMEPNVLEISLKRKTNEQTSR